MIGNTTRAIVLAAGNSSRFNTGKTKQLEPVCGRPMMMHLAYCLSSMNIPTTIVIGKNSSNIKKTVNDSGIAATFVTQDKQLGTGHAIKCTEDTWDRDHILILNGDVPLLNREWIEKLYAKHTSEDKVITFFAAHVLDPTGYGRVVEHNNTIQIIEEKDCNDKQREVSLINSGIYIIKKDFLSKAIDKLSPSKVTGEYYVTDLVKIAYDMGYSTNYLTIPYDHVRGVNTLEELWEVEHIMKSSLIRHWMLNGVRFNSPQTTRIDINTTIGRGSKIGMNVDLSNSSLGENVIVGLGSILKGCSVEDDVAIHAYSVISDSTIKKRSEIGPFARLRNNAIIEQDAIIGNFVEVKNSIVGSDSKAKHLAYLGDASLGKGVNIGAGTITCNHDGFKKHKTQIGDGAYIGSNSTLIAPIKIGEGAYSAAGSTLNKDVPSNDLAIARSRQENKENYAERIRSKKIKTSSTSKPKDKIKLNFLGAMKADDLSEEIF